jgi:hypothetical protein
MRASADRARTDIARALTLEGLLMPESYLPRSRRQAVGQTSPSEIDDSITVTAPAPATPGAKPPRRPRWRLRILLAINAILAGLYLLSQLDQATIKKLGPPGQVVFDLINPPVEPEISASGRRLMAVARELGGEATVMQRSRQFLGIFGTPDLFHVGVNRTNLGDAALAELDSKHGDHIWGLDLRNTKVTDQGLRHLEGLSHLAHLTLGNDDSKLMPNAVVPISPITDAGLIRLKGLTQLMTLNVCGLPISDSGLDALKDLPQLGGLYLSRTKVTGTGLANLKSLPTLALIYLDDCEVTAEGLSALARASNLQLLSLRGTPLTSKELQVLKLLNRLRQLDITGCGLLDEEVRDLQKSMPSVKIERR